MPQPIPTYADLLARTDAPAGSSWHLFTEQPERGMADFAGPEQILRATPCVREGRAISLDYALDAFDPPMSRARGIPQHHITAKHDQARDDSLDGFHLQASTQVDGLRHRRASGHGFYNGVPDDAIAPRSPRLGVQLWAETPLVGRGLLIDIDGHLRERGTPLDHTTGPALTPALLDEALAAQHCTVEDGDLVLVHTGWAHWYLTTDPDTRTETRAARRATGFAQSREFAAWCWDHRIALMATDTFAVEVLPVLPDGDFHDSAPEDAGMMHQELIAKLGLPLGELWNLTALTEDCRATGHWDSLLTVKPLHLTGGVGSPANATALR
ncbi:cyclase family protein [Streptomyces sp. NBC_01016]|uniref:cyclase family protein n=1 Tax=Streptomyces sp. NBC_01016 TaxID=2903720 RepID=UPI0022586900|nr:cyclase family protein [Streptomyces sp. NBC_01016]MCX4834651.1 cyclase family protein [Streptomyces sp. NBC_01016]